MKTADQLRIIVVGLGIQGRKRQAVAGSSVVATVDPHVPDASVRDLSEISPERYDAALLCTPDAVKFDLMQRLLSQGKHVLVEKPLLETPAALRALEQIGRNSGAACYTAYNHRFEPNILRLKEELKAGTIGRLYFARLFYGNGTAHDIALSPWRDQGLGALADLGSHLLDLCLFLFDVQDDDMELWAADRIETRAPDRVVIGSRRARPALQLEMTFLSWRNDFTIDVYGEGGSLHVQSLCKWGPSSFTRRTRVLPSGRPPEESQILVQADPTWQLEYDYFLELCRNRVCDLSRDFRIATILDRLASTIMIGE